MSPPRVVYDHEQLIAQISWVRALALRVAPDAHGAEDLAQDAMVVALRERDPGRGDLPDSERSAALRRWLAAVVRNLGRTRRRSARRRAEREATLAGQELPPSTLELVERVSVQRELVGALLELDEPYRSTLLMRYFEELSQREISERAGVPVSTVGTRIAEGIARLRRKFVRRDTWLSSIAAVFRGPGGTRPPAAITGALLMSASAKLILAGAVLVGAFFVLRGVFSPPPPPTGSDQAAATVESQPEAGPGYERIEVNGESPATPEQAFRDIPEHATVEYGVVRGSVIDVSGAPVGGVEVAFLRPAVTMGEGHAVVPPSPVGSVTSDAAGRFETEGALPMELMVVDDYFSTVFKGVAREESDDQVLIVVARRIPLGGVVVDPQGTPVDGVVVTVQATVTLRGRDLRSSSLVIPETSSDKLGAFVVDGAFAVETAQIQFRAPGFVTEIRPVPQGGDTAMHVVLSSDRDGAHTIRGQVVVEDGRPAGGAYVSTGFMASRTDDQGFFVIDFEPWLSRVDPVAPTIVTAISPGRMPVSRTLPSVDEARATGWPERIVLELAGEPLTLGGTVVDEQGEPVEGLLVEPADMSDFGMIQSEGMPAFFGSPTTQELLAGGGEAYTDDNGRFEVKGLLERSYTLRILDRQSLLTATTDPADAGSRDLRIVFDRRALGTIAGRIVDRHGSGIGGVRVGVSGSRTGELLIGRGTVTDEEGSFSLTGVTTQPDFLRIEGDAIVPELFRELNAGDDVGALRLEVGRRCRVQFDWGDWPVPDDELRVVNRTGEPLMMMRLSGNSIGEAPSVGSRKGVTEVFVVSDAATHAIVTRGGEEVMRLPVSLDADELNVIRL